MGIVPPAGEPPTAAEDREWDWHGRDRTDKIHEIIDRLGWQGMADAHAWHEARDGEDPPEVEAAYKLPHHEIVGGSLEVVWHGVRAAMEVLDGSRGGVEIPDGDREAVHEHLAAHYRQFGKEPPDLRS